MPRVTELRGETGTTGETGSVVLSGVASVDIAEAVYAEHDCRDDSCDIAAALAADCPLSAAYLLQGATETPLLDAVVRFYFPGGLDPAAAPEGSAARADWQAWLAYHREYGRECGACGSFTYGDDCYTPDRCGNCLAEFTSAGPEFFTIEIGGMDGAAFADDWRGELARILRECARRVEAGDDSGSLRDVNGNTVGSFKTEGVN